MKQKDYIDRRGDHRTRFVADNGKIQFVSSEGYQDKRDLDTAVDSLREFFTKFAGLDIEIILGVLSMAARGEGIDPELCETVEKIANDWNAPDFDKKDLQALYDCGPKR